jgi:hypothetical protein
MSIAVRRDERGIALIMTLLLAVMLAAMAVGVYLMMGNTNLVSRFHTNEAQMKYAADAGLEWARNQLNSGVALPAPGAGGNQIENNVIVRDAGGAVVGASVGDTLRRSTWIAPSGNTTGEYGIYASAIVQVTNKRGATVYRRGELKQDPFSRFARFFNTWSCCAWGPAETVFGPLHSNQGMALINGAPGATFNGPVTTVGAITNQAVGHFNQGVSTGVAAIPFPTVVSVNNLQTYATAGQEVIAGDARAVPLYDPDTRIEFVALDLNGDGVLTGNDEGFFRVWKITAGGTAAQQQQRRNYVTARRWANVTALGWGASGPAPTLTPTDAADPNLISPNCGGTPNWNGLLGWTRTDSIRNLAAVAPWNVNTNKAEGARRALAANDAQCFLGGDGRLFGNRQGYIMADPTGYGSWQAYPGWGGAPPAALVNYFNANPNLVDASVAGAGGVNALALTFWPISRTYNVNLKHVIFVTGSVAISGTVRGHVTIAATGNVLLPDDIQYVTAANTNCADILGVIATSNVAVEDNSLNTPFNVKNVWTVGFDDTPNETFNGFFLTLGNFQGENLAGPDGAPLAPENCGNTSRGCKSIIGGTIQQGVSGTYSGTTGWAEQDTYDVCGVQAPPPYYPTTGRFTKYRYYEIDPVGFDPNTWFNTNQ